MIVICVNEVYGRAGYHRLIADLANGLSRSGHAVAMLGFQRDARRPVPLAQQKFRAVWPIDDAVQVAALQSLTAADGRLLHRHYHPVLKGRLERSEYEFTANDLAVLRRLNDSLTERDTVVFTSPITAVAYSVALQGAPRRPRTVLQAHGNYDYYSDLMPTVLRARDAIERVQTSAVAARRQFTEVWGEDNVVAVPNIPAEELGTVEQVDHAGVNIVQPASFQPLKNQLDTVRAFSMLTADGIHLTLWGVASDANPYVAQVRQLITDLGLSDRVSMPGFGSEEDVYATADIITLSSLAEGFPNTLAESALHSLPVVAYDFDFGPRDIIEDGASGYIVPLRDVASLARRLDKLAHDAELRQQFGRRAREIYDAEFSFARIAQKYEEFLGAPAGTTIDFDRHFLATGTDPVPLGGLTFMTRTDDSGTLIELTVESPVPIVDVRIDNGSRVTAPQIAHHTDGTTTIVFVPRGVEVISYCTQEGSDDRYYLATTTTDGLGVEVFPWLRREYGPDGPGRPTVLSPTNLPQEVPPTDAIPVEGAHGNSGAAVRRRPDVADVIWKVRQIGGTIRRALSPR